MKMSHSDKEILLDNLYDVLKPKIYDTKTKKVISMKEFNLKKNVAKSLGMLSFVLVGEVISYFFPPFAVVWDGAWALYFGYKGMKAKKVGTKVWYFINAVISTIGPLKILRIVKSLKTEEISISEAIQKISELIKQSVKSNKKIEKLLESLKKIEKKPWWRLKKNELRILEKTGKIPKLTEKELTKIIKDSSLKKFVRVNAKFINISAKTEAVVHIQSKDRLKPVESKKTVEKIKGPNTYLTNRLGTIIMLASKIKEMRKNKDIKEIEKMIEHSYLKKDEKTILLAFLYFLKENRDIKRMKKEEFKEKMNDKIKEIEREKKQKKEKLTY